MPNVLGLWVVLFERRLGDLQTLTGVLDHDDELGCTGIRLCSWLTPSYSWAWASWFQEREGFLSGDCGFKAVGDFLTVRSV